MRKRSGGVLDLFSLFLEINIFQIFQQDFSRFLHNWLILKVGENTKSVKNLDDQEPDPRSEFEC